MSVRRPAPLVAQHQVLTVGALADRLPGSTRLSQVLAAGATHLAKHKTADTEAPKRDLFGRDIGFRTTNARPLIAHWLKKLEEKVLEYMRAEAAGNNAALSGLMQEIAGIVNTIFHKIGGIDDMEILQRQGAYFLLNWFYQHGTTQQSSDAQKVLSIALHEETDKEFQNIRRNLHLGVQVLSLDDGPALALGPPKRGGVVLNAPAPSDFKDASNDEKRQKVEDDRKAKLLQRQQDMQDGKISKELEKEVEKQADAKMPQDGEMIAGVRERSAANDQIDQDAAEQQVNSEMNSGNRDYEDPTAASDDEGDDEDTGQIDEDKVRKDDDPENSEPRRGAQDFR